MVELQFDEIVDIVSVGGHYEGRVNGQFVVSGDTRNEVKNELSEMGYYK